MEDLQVLEDRIGQLDTGVPALAVQQREELRRLRREVAELRMERELLKRRRRFSPRRRPGDPLPVHRVGFRELDVGAALTCVRTDLLLRSLGRGPASQRELLTTTGLVRDVTLPILEALVQQGRLRIVVGDDTERFELAETATGQRT